MSARTRGLVPNNPQERARRARIATAAAENAASVARFRRESQLLAVGLLTGVVLTGSDVLLGASRSATQHNAASNVGFVVLFVGVIWLRRLSALAWNWIPETTLPQRRKRAWMFAIATTAGLAALLFWHREGPTLQFRSDD